ncbi:MAG: hypothetical protein ACOX6Q_02160 [Candidatus Dojkabacteria bacterium]|jgi:hypothetical protein
MEKNVKTNKYEAMGFVEALIAIMVVGISAVVLMQIAANTMQSMIQNERVDQVTQYAVEGAVMAQAIASKNREIGGGLFPMLTGVERCFAMERVSEGEYAFVKEGEDTFKSYLLDSDRNVYKDGAAIYDEEGNKTEFFRILCIDYPPEEGYSFLIGRVVVGQSSSTGTVSKGNQVKDYSYYTSIKL